MSELQVHLALIRENWDRHDHWFDALCNNLVRGHMKELEALAAQSPPPVVSEGVVEASPDLITQIAHLLAADPVCGGRVASGTIEAIAGICSRGCDLETLEAQRAEAFDEAARIAINHSNYGHIEGNKRAFTIARDLEHRAAAIRNLGKETRQGDAPPLPGHDRLGRGGR